MTRHAIWTTGASQDYLKADSRLASTEAIDASVELLKLFPDMGALVSASGRVRRVLIGRTRIYGLYYGIHSDRIIVVALVDLRQDPKTIEKLLGSRGIDT